MEPMGLLAWIIVGLIAGWLAGYIIPTRTGIIGDTIIGMVGALLGGVLFNAIGEPGASGLNLWSIFVAFIGAVVLLFLLRAVSRESRITS